MHVNKRPWTSFLPRLSRFFSVSICNEVGWRWFSRRSCFCFRNAWQRNSYPAADCELLLLLFINCYRNLHASFPIACQVPEMARPVSSRSQDDAMVSYIFQRPQPDGNFQSFGKHQSRWLGDESIVEVRTVNMLCHWAVTQLSYALLCRWNLVLPMRLPKHPIPNKLQSTVNNGANLTRSVVTLLSNLNPLALCDIVIR